MNIKTELSNIFPGEPIILISGFDDALMGAFIGPEDKPVAVYDRQACIDIIAQDLPYKVALEYFETYIETVDLGPSTPIFIFTVNNKSKCKHSLN